MYYAPWVLPMPWRMHPCAFRSAASPQQKILRQRCRLFEPQWRGYVTGRSRRTRAQAIAQTIERVVTPARQAPAQSLRKNVATAHWRHDRGPGLQPLGARHLVVLTQVVFTTPAPDLAEQQLPRADLRPLFIVSTLQGVEVLVVTQQGVFHGDWFVIG